MRTRVNSDTNNKVGICRKQVEKLENSLVGLRVIREGKKSEFWNAILDLIEEKRGEIEGQLDEYSNLDDCKRIGFLEARRQLRFFKEIPDAVDAIINQREKRISELLEEIRNLQKEENL